MRINKLILLAAIALCTACAPATPSKEDLNDQLENTIANESELWTKLNIDNYQITVNHSSVWVEYSLIIKVENNKVVDSKASCGDALLEDSSFCNEVISNISPKDYTIQGLFDDLKKSRESFEAEDWGGQPISSWSESIFITFDPQYHYPVKIRYDIPEAFDEEYIIEVLSFTILQK